MKFRSRRRPTDFDAVLIAESGEHSVSLRNISPDGVKVTGLGGYLYPEAEVKLVVHGRPLPGRVCWVDQDTAGVKLKSPMPKDLLTRVARATGGGQAYRFSP